MQQTEKNERIIQKEYKKSLKIAKWFAKKEG